MSVADLIRSPGLWAWSASIIAVAALAVGIILAVTRNAIAAMARAAGSMISQAEGAMRPAAPAQAPFVTVGRARFSLAEDMYMLVFERRFNGDSEMTSEDLEAEARQALERFVQAFVDGGGDPDDILSEGVRDGDTGQVIAAMTLLVSDDEDKSKEIAATALANGFREDRATGREIFAAQDATSMLSRRAVARSITAMDAIKANLGIDGDVDVVKAELEIESDGDVEPYVICVKSAISWRRRG